MTPEQWEQIAVIYHAALEIDPGEREAFLDHACQGDAALRREVESLIAADSHGEMISQLEAAPTADGLSLNQRSDAQTSQSSSFITPRLKSALVFATGVILTAAVLVVAYYKLLDRTRLSNQKPRMAGAVEKKLTNTGNLAVARTAISPDGKYIAYALQDNQHTSSLWLRQLDAFSSVRVINSANATYLGVTFSRDGNSLYYGIREGYSQVASLYRIPLLGGVSKKVMLDLDSPISFSPDGSQFVFRRVFRERSEGSLFVANTDGSGETKIATAKFPESFGDPAWSPNGKVIACNSGHADGGLNRYVIEVSVGDWKVRLLSARKWFWVGPLEWLSDGRGLLMIASESPAEPSRVWRLSYPSGEAGRVTNNAIPYTRLSLSADSSALLVSQQKRNTHLWMIPGDEPRLARKMTFGAGGFRGYLNWTPDGKIVFDSDTAGVPDISMIEEEGGNLKQLFADSTGKATAVSSEVSPDGRYVVFGFDQTGIRHIWRMEIDGGKLIQLTNGKGEDHPNCSPDGKWVFYTAIGSAKSTLWKVPLDGGEPVQLTTSQTRFPVVSPNGKLIACFYSNAETNLRWRLALIPFEGGEPVRIFPQALNAGFPAKWTPDGRALTYTDRSQSNLWLQPVNGGEPKMLTDFSSDLIFGYDWSPDGKRLACVRGIWERDLILIRNFQ